MKTLASRRFPGPDFERLDDVEILPAKLPGGLGGERPDVGALATMFEVVDDETLELLPNLRVIANYGVGYNGIDVEACARRGVGVANTPGVVDGATADLAMALLLCARRRVVEADGLVRGGAWQSLEADLLTSEDVHESTLGIIGCGRIGRAVARRARGFDMRLLYSQRRRLDGELERRLGLEWRPLEALLAEVDALTIHCPLTPETTGLIGRSGLALLRDGATLVNTARGGVVDEHALVDELLSGRISAGLDVFAHEPDVPVELRSLPNVVLSPHVGTATRGTRAAMTRLVVDNILAVAAGEPLLSPVPPRAAG